MAQVREHGEKLNILLVEDDEVDRKAVRRTFSRLGIDARIVEASDGEQALDILRGQSDIAPPQPPFIVLLDINMPRMDGIEVLQQLRSAESPPELRNTIVFMLTTSEAERDLERAYAHNIAGYLVKSDDRGGLKRVAEMLRAYREVVLFP